MSNLYVYAIAKMFELPNIRGIKEENLFLATHKDIAAVVSNACFDEIDPTRENVRSHVKAQEQLIMDRTVLPLGFGTIAPSDMVGRLLEENYSTLSSELERLSDMIEVEVKVMWNRDALLNELESVSRRYSVLRKKLENAVSPKTKQETILEIGRLVEKTAEEWKESYAKPAFKTLRDLAVEAKENSVSRIEVLLDGSFLIKRQDDAAFLELLDHGDGRSEGRLNFKYIGPLPPYNFIKMKLEI